MSTETGNGFTKAAFKSDIPIKVLESGVYQIGEREYPKEIFSFTSEQNIDFRDGWHLEPGLVLPSGKKELHYRISSTDPVETKQFFIPACWFTAVRPD